MTNGDKFRNMTDEELAEFMYEHMMCISCPIYTADCEDGCAEKWKRYLKGEQNG